ncbi:Signal peptidase complex catalytic subunit SEC11 [Mycena indigotica]|uniref:Signal peptidase complex catalytic subunit SEC11 n=1 Tax=Mycena indigotica TaxID=2126181 RepID=A0A8H6SEK0_9AGAR|nr:Signal peptidase complex catalytic subunit SEC11 [Mycena indigotica]KAF7296907.1 Signal peptidase complex catalytic subunit SEC11 [Mycena indigotica]
MGRIRRTLLQGLLFASSLSSSYMAYAAAGILTNCKSPAVVVLTGSMEPGIHRGDLLFLSNWSPQEYQNGDITVYEVPGQMVPIVHRVLEMRESGASPRRFMTKGDNNDVNDISLYNGLEWLEPEHLVGKVQGIIPYVGYVSIIFNEYPRVRNAVFLLLGLSSYMVSG